MGGTKKCTKSAANNSLSLLVFMMTQIALFGWNMLDCTKMGKKKSRIIWLRLLKSRFKGYS